MMPSEKSGDHKSSQRPQMSEQHFMVIQPKPKAVDHPKDAHVSKH